MNRQSIGDRGGAVTAEHVPQWVCQGLQTRVQRGLATAACAPAPAAPDLVATVAIRRLYVHTVATDLEAVLALDVRHTRRDGGTRGRAYRGGAQVFNWFNGDGEIEGVVNQALRDSVVQIAGELRNPCRGGGTPSAAIPSTTGGPREARSAADAASGSVRHGQAVALRVRDWDVRNHFVQGAPDNRQE